ncbi:hypothetical protein G4B88_001078 [Cannabis sativa]|uniref:RNase H type-1 domain-containing protein n=1 Tax=Cannabis sativa TaxID=3483 RepID=A0A7J6EFS6_CANSA|nr:hypothetical protein G4B88_001078 [Cannabis sativa]
MDVAMALFPLYSRTQSRNTGAFDRASSLNRFTEKSAHLIGDNRLPDPDQVYADDLYDACFLVDASVVDTVAGIRVVLYRPGGNEIITMQSICTVSSVLEAELIAILTALERAWANQYHHQV